MQLPFGAEQRYQLLRPAPVRRDPFSRQCAKMSGQIDQPYCLIDVAICICGQYQAAGTVQSAYLLEQSSRQAALLRIGEATRYRLAGPMR